MSLRRPALRGALCRLDSVKNDFFTDSSNLYSTRDQIILPHEIAFKIFSYQRIVLPAKAFQLGGVVTLQRCHEPHHSP